AARADHARRGLSRRRTDVRRARAPRAAGRGLIRREPPSAFHGAERFTDTARPLPPISVAQRHGAGRAEIAERIGRAVDIADASAERRRVFLVERILDPDAEAMAPRGVEIVR